MKAGQCFSGSTPWNIGAGKSARRLACGLVALCLVSCTSDATREGAASAPLATATSPSSASDATHAATARSVDLAPLHAAGISIIGSETEVIAAASPASPLQLTVDQATRLMVDTATGGGVLGTDLDALAPLEAGAPPMSYLVAAWVSQGSSAGSTAARMLMTDEDWSLAPQIRYPWAVVAMFVNDVAAAEQAAAEQATAEQPGLRRPSATIAQLSAAPAGPCSTVTNFLSTEFNRLFDALKIDPGAGSNVVVGALAFLGNAALGLAKTAVQGLVAVITAPVLAVIKAGVAVLGVATLVVSFFKNQSLQVTLEPSNTLSVDVYHFSVGAEAPVRGQFVARVNDLTSEFPPALVDCANAAGAPLPKLIEPGADAIWSVNNDFGVIAPGPLNTKVGADLAARLDFSTGNESEDTARGEVTFDPAVASVRIPRQAVDTFLSFARAQVDAAKNALINQVPAGPARDAATLAATQFIDPTLNRLNAEIAGQVGGVFSLTGTAPVVVKHHSPPETTTTATTAPAPSAQAVAVHLDRPAIAPLLAGRVVDLVACDGLFGHWTGVIRNGGIVAAGISQPFNDIPLDFTVGGSELQTVHTSATSTFPTYLGPVTVSLELDITVDDTRLDGPTMSITGTGTSSGVDLEVDVLLGDAARDMPIDSAPVGSCG